MSFTRKCLQKCNIPLAQGNCKELNHNLNLWLFMYETEAMLAAEKQKAIKLKKSLHYLRHSLNGRGRSNHSARANIHHLRETNVLGSYPPQKLVDQNCRIVSYLTTDKYKRISPEMLKMLDPDKKPNILHVEWIEPVASSTRGLFRPKDGNKIAGVAADGTGGGDVSGGTSGDIGFGVTDGTTVAIATGTGVGTDNCSNSFDSIIVNANAAVSTGKETDGVATGGGGDIETVAVDTSKTLPSSLSKHLHDPMETKKLQNEIFGINFYQEESNIPNMDMKNVDYLDPNALAIILTKLKTSQAIDDNELKYLIKFLVTALYADSEMVGELLQVLKGRDLLSNDIIGYLRRLLQHSVLNEAVADMMERLEDVIDVFPKSTELFGDSTKYFPAKEKKVNKPKHENEKRQKSKIIRGSGGGKQLSSHTESMDLKGGGSNITYNVSKKELQFGNDNHEKHFINSSDFEVYDDKVNVLYSNQNVRSKIVDNLDVDKRNDKFYFSDYHRSDYHRSDYHQLDYHRSDSKPYNVPLPNRHVEQNLRDEYKPVISLHNMRKILRNIRNNKPPLVTESLDLFKNKPTPTSMNFKRRSSRVSHVSDPNRSIHPVTNITKKPSTKEFYGYLIKGGFFKPWPIDINFAQKQKFYRLSTAQWPSILPVDMVPLQLPQPTPKIKTEKNIKTYPKLDTYLPNRSSKTIPQSYYLKERINKTRLSTVKPTKLVRLPTFMYQKTPKL